ncbi:helix-turn-helix domain-containing protein [Sphingomonas sp. SORGH_AS_0879]|uniref:helix-turn-helix domain-containing protein n=1 Tax=Sphingomonas sp. SORGH_AS_0879 TaxID=3041790 RepID=UPI002781D363|nr:helix-turn-helix domain-containing protein [Sphingomonas sp. SORGH_AS_0879]MDQ1229298.1 chromosomal replication initiation ATPase DnaA [Sphingomonas sp. SORGH_AS_0879]
MTAAPDRQLGEILAAAAIATGHSVDDMLRQCRTKPLVLARQAAILAMREATGASLPAIGRVMRRGHPAIHTALRRAEARCELHPDFRALVDRLRAFGDTSDD